jgi:transposase-like protein
MFNAEIIQLCVRWHSTYRLSYRDLVARMAQSPMGLALEPLPNYSLDINLHF